MSALRNAAVAAATTQLPSSFYDRENGPNPVLQALDQELKACLQFLKKRATPTYKKPEDEPFSRPADMLSNVWKKYQPRLPPNYFLEKLLDVGDDLVSSKEYNTALSQCFERFLHATGSVNPDEIYDVNVFQDTFYPQEMKRDTAALMTRALLGRSVCLYQMTRQTDPRLQKKQSVEKCIQVLATLQMITGAILPDESLCWLVFNGTVQIYTTSRHLMSIGHSSRVLQYLLWASMCLEMSIPLVTAKYLGWRATLYAAVCQCYYDCKQDEHAEDFARRGLGKIQELSNLEMMSGDRNLSGFVDSFRSATVRMAAMVFKRAVFETRRKPKGVLRPKSRVNLKETLNLSWPRTPTEVMLVDMFEGSSAQFLAILESLNNSNRRILHTAPAAPESEPEILDVCSELMLAAEEILAGGGGKRAMGIKSQMALGASPLASVVMEGSLMQMAIKGGDTVPVESAIQLIKLAYGYEQWEVFQTLLSPVLQLIKESNSDKLQGEEKALNLLSAMMKVNSSRLQKRKPTREEQEAEKVETFNPAKKGKQQTKGKTVEKPADKPAEPDTTNKVNNGDDLLQVGNALLSIVSEPFNESKADVDMVVDATLFLWSKCRPVFSKFQVGTIESLRFHQKADNPDKESGDTIQFNLKTPESAWIYLLETVRQGICWSGISCVDPVMTAEVSVRLAQVYESRTKMADLANKTVAPPDSRTTFIESEVMPRENTASTKTTQTSQLTSQISAKHQLELARDVLQQGLVCLDEARRAGAENDGKHVGDFTWIKEINDSAQPSETSDSSRFSLDSFKPSVSPTEVLVRGLHLELILAHHRVCLKLSEHTNPSDKNKLNQAKGSTINPVTIEEAGANVFRHLSRQCHKNKLSKALLFAQKALLLGCKQGPTQEQIKLLEDAVTFVKLAQAEERSIFINNLDQKKQTGSGQVAPSPPLLVCRTDTCMVFRPAAFEPESGDKVAFYRIFARPISGVNTKVRLSDNKFPGTGEEISASDCQLRVTSLHPNQRYIFALAAYTTDGKIIGGQIGETTKPITACHPLPILLTWGFICQLAYQVGCYTSATIASEALWEHFTMKPDISSSDSFITHARKDFRISLFRLREKAVQQSSPILLRQFLTSIFVSTDMTIRQRQLFCDVLCPEGPAYQSQIQRLLLCERLLVAMEVAGLLNEGSLVLQAVVQVYGLLAPMLFYKIPPTSVLQLLQRCHGVIQGLPPDLIHKRQTSTAASLKHMIACIVYHLAKLLRSLDQKEAASAVLESGLCLLSPADYKLPEDKDDVPEDTLKMGAGLKSSKPTAPTKTPNEENKPPKDPYLTALEAYMMSINPAENTLTGSEDTGLILAFIQSQPASAALKEVEKFRSRPQYLELLVHAAQRSLREGAIDQVLQSCDENISWLHQRNVVSVGKGKTENENPKKFAATMVEYKKADDKTSKPEKGKEADKKKTKAKYKPLRVTASMSETSQKLQEERELKALGTLSVSFVNKYKRKVQNQKERNSALSETPWRSQLNIIQGMANFQQFLQKLEQKEKFLGFSILKTDILDHEWWAFETAGVVVVDAVNHPSQYALDSSQKEEQLREPVKLNEGQTPQLIELAAAAVTESINLNNEGPTQSPQIEVPHINKPEKVVVDKLPEESTTPFVDNLKASFAQLTRAVVLAHRGQQWILFQNASRTLWNSANSALLHVCRMTSPDCSPEALTRETLQSMLWHPFYMASDCLLDMISVLKQSSEKLNAKNKRDVSVSVLEPWMGTVHDEQGGASLKFDPLLDDTSLVDSRWIRRMVVRSLELLSSQQKYEKLVDLSLRFTALTSNRYAEQIIPLMVQSQRQIQKRIKQVGGPSPPQPHFKALHAQLGHITSARDYLTAQLELQFDKHKLAISEPTNSGSKRGVVYEAQDAYRLSAVPLDTKINLQELSHTLEQAHYTARSLQHSRKLLCLYLAGLQTSTLSINDGLSSANQNLPSANQPQPTVPPRTLATQFSNPSEVFFTPLPQSQLKTVISSYEKTIEILIGKNLKGIAAQALHELGNIFIHAQNMKAAARCWSHSLDLIFGTSDTVHTWRNLVKDCNDISSAFLERCGLWGCLLAGVLSSNIAQYTLADDAALRTQCCQFSGYLFKGLLRSSLPHPAADWQYASYDVGDGYNLCPGIDFLSDKFRCDARQLVAALKWIIHELTRNHCNLFVLPLLTLHQYFASCICCNLLESVEGRIIRVRVLAELSFFSEAVTTLHQLLSGERLLGRFDYLLGNSLTNGLPFSSSKPVTDPGNLKPEDKIRSSTQRMNKLHPLWSRSNVLAIESLVQKKLSSTLSGLFGPHLTCQVALAHAHLLKQLAKTIPVLPTSDDKRSPDGKRWPNQIPCSNIDPGIEPMPVVFCGGRSMTLEEVKDYLLLAANQKLTPMINVFWKNRDKGEVIPAAELELLIQSYLLKALILQQRHFGRMAAQTALTAMRTLQRADSTRDQAQQSMSSRDFVERSQKPTWTESEKCQYQFQNLQAAARLDMRLWLQCRCELITSLLMEVRGMGDIKGSDADRKNDLANCRQYCAEGLAEAEVAGDLEMQAQFLFFGVEQNLLEGKRIEHTVSLLEDALTRLQRTSGCSHRGKQLLVVCLLLKSELGMMAQTPQDKSNEINRQITLSNYLKAHSLVLSQLETLGQKIDYPEQGHSPNRDLDLMCFPTSPIQNVYLPHLQQLVQVQLRVALCLTTTCVGLIKQGKEIEKATQMCSKILMMLGAAQALSQVCCSRESSLETEVLFVKGRVERMVVFLGRFGSRRAAATLLRAIKISYTSIHDLGLIRQAYLEIALLYMYSSGLITVTENFRVEPIADHFDESVSVIQESDNQQGDKSEQEEKERERRVVSMAIKCAALAARAQQARNLITGNKSVTSDSLDRRTISSMPDFMLMDLLGQGVLSTTQNIQLAPANAARTSRTEQPMADVAEAENRQVNQVRAAGTDLSWIYLLGYQVVLQRLMNTSTTPTSYVSSNQLEKDAKEIKSKAMTNPKTTLQQLSSENKVRSDLARYMLVSGPWAVRLASLHSYLNANLGTYMKECCAPYPPAEMNLPPLPSQSCDLKIIQPTYAKNLITKSDLDRTVSGQGVVDSTKITQPPTAGQETYRRDSFLPSEVGPQLFVQWFVPTLEENPIGCFSPGDTSEAIMLLYTWVNQNNTCQQGLRWVALPKLKKLHQRVSILAHNVDLTLATEPAVPSPKTYDAPRNKTALQKMFMNQQEEFLHCLAEVSSLIKGDSHSTQPKPADLPELNPAHLQSLTNLLDPAIGLCLKGAELLPWFLALFT